MIRKIFFDRILKKIIFKNKIYNNDFHKENIKIFKSYEKSLKGYFFNKKSLISNNLVGQRIYYHNGKGISSLKINIFMIGYKLGEFLYVLKNKKIKKKGKKKKK